MAMVASPNTGKLALPPPPLNPTTTTHKAAAPYNPYSGGGRRRASPSQHGGVDGDMQGVDGIVLVLRAAAAALAFVAVALVASCRHGDWMEFTRYQEYRYLLAVSVVASVYSALQAMRGFLRMRAAGNGACAATFLDFAGDQAVGYLLITASSAALPITIRMRSAVVNTFTDAITASISLAFVSFAALSFSAMLTGFRLSAAYSY
uniref:CASP-like protein n=1 Tax=Leersia perrieri TaxID=77586 RepID=A0A0D9X383_9ORYZ